MEFQGYSMLILFNKEKRWLHTFAPVDKEIPNEEFLKRRPLSDEILGLAKTEIIIWNEGMGKTEMVTENIVLPTRTPDTIIIEPMIGNKKGERFVFWKQ